MGDDRQDPPEQPRPAPGADRTQRIPPPVPDDTDRTQRIAPPGAGDTDRTQRIPPGGQPDDGASSHPAPWSGRAEVRPPQPADDGGPGDWYVDQDQSDRRWWLPIVVGIVAMLLLGVLGFGVWLIVRSTQRDPGPSPLPTVAPSVTGPPSPTAPAAPSDEPSETAGQPTAPQTTAASPTTAAPAQVPPLVGLTREQAVAVLERLDLDYRIRTRESDRPPGTVVATEPGPGEPLPEDEEITLIVAVPRVGPTLEPSTSPSVPRSTR
ncbi:PASTA domain-containing protein [Micromonospora echinofusca]|uniref:PASTA domain-containing protein n=1 Tax=Micromonospora echinofusca TaxID=47858 RepID=A0ABS3VJ53_MICEH|nr:PASTA domain-containing protein [Micromonospora echinofusca]MBO4204557.1 PASTA domain-containing protein [Micromonospora echinofusca]